VAGHEIQVKDPNGRHRSDVVRLRSLAEHLEPICGLIALRQSVGRKSQEEAVDRGNVEVPNPGCKVRCVGRRSQVEPAAEIQPAAGGMKEYPYLVGEDQPTGRSQRAWQAVVVGIEWD
jgi:hypothetical protein